MRRLPILILLLILYWARALSEQTHPDNSSAGSQLGEILHSQYQLASKVAEIPQAVRVALIGLMKHDPRLADPGERFNATDVVDQRFPMRRLTLAGGTPTSWFVCYEHGGRGYLRQIIIFTIEGHSAACRTSCSVGVDVRTVPDLQSALDRRVVRCDPCDKNGYF